MNKKYLLTSDDLVHLSILNDDINTNLKKAWRLFDKLENQTITSDEEKEYIKLKSLIKELQDDKYIFLSSKEVY